MDKYCIEMSREGIFLLIESEGDFYNHSFQDVHVASFMKKEKADEVCDMLNDKYKDWKSE